MVACRRNSVWKSGIGRRWPCDRPSTATDLHDYRGGAMRIDARLIFYGGVQQKKVLTAAVQVYEARVNGQQS